MPTLITGLSFDNVKFGALLVHLSKKFFFKTKFINRILFLHSGNSHFKGSSWSILLFMENWGWGCQQWFDLHFFRAGFSYLIFASFGTNMNAQQAGKFLTLPEFGYQLHARAAAWGHCYNPFSKRSPGTGSLNAVLRSIFKLTLRTHLTDLYSHLKAWIKRIKTHFMSF